MVPVIYCHSCHGLVLYHHWRRLWCARCTVSTTSSNGRHCSKNPSAGCSINEWEVKYLVGSQWHHECMSTVTSYHTKPPVSYGENKHTSTHIQCMWVHSSAKGRSLCVADAQALLTLTCQSMAHSRCIIMTYMYVSWPLLATLWLLGYSYFNCTTRVDSSTGPS